MRDTGSMRASWVVLGWLVAASSAASAQPQPEPQPEPQPQPQPVQPQPQPQPQAQPQPQPPPYYPGAPPVTYAQPAPYTYGTAPRSHFYDGEVIGDFAVVGTLMSIDLLVHQDVKNGGLGTMILAAGVLGGGAAGYVLTQHYDIDAGTAHATTTGLLVGAANGALLIRPTQAYHGDQVLGLLLVGSAAGTIGGFAYGRTADLTPGQSTFIGNVTLLGTATAAFTAILGSHNGKYDNWENGTLALGLDAGVVAGALVAPHLDWSPRRSKYVFASTLVGAFVGGMLAGILTNNKSTDANGNTTSGHYNDDVITASMAAGLWAGFGLSIALTHDDAPDLRYARPAPGAAGAPSMSLAPWLGRDASERAAFGVATGGTW